MKHIIAYLSAARRRCCAIHMHTWPLNALSLDHGIISFTKSESDDARLVAFQIEHSDPKRVLDRARGMGLTCDGMCVQVTGVQLEIAQGTR